MDVGELQSDARSDFPFLGTGVDEQKIFLAIVEEAEIALRIVGGEAGCNRRRSRLDHGKNARGCRLKQYAPPRRCPLDVTGHEGTNALKRVGGDAAAIAQPACQFAVIHGAAAESGFGEAARAAKFADLLENLFVHDGIPSPALNGRYGKRTKSLGF